MWASVVYFRDSADGTRSSHYVAKNYVTVKIACIYSLGITKKPKAKCIKHKKPGVIPALFIRSLYNSV
jgi:hypothetical protein